MITIRNLRKQALHLEKKASDGKHVLLLIPARGSVAIANSEMSQDIQIKSERGDLKYTFTPDLVEPSAEPAE
jgi:hypothetical protein